MGESAVRGDRPGPGDVLGDRYRLIERLGSGGISDVFRAHDLRLDRPVAVKLFRADLADAVDPRRTTRETHLLGGLSHPTVVGVLDASDDSCAVPYLVMELVEGHDLGGLLAAGTLSADLTRRIVADVADALALLHSRSVVHGDVKPANVLVLDDAETDRTGVTAKLSDFGIAHLVDGGRITASDRILGTPAYFSPEQVRGDAVGPPSDVYSLGLVLIECLTGNRAFPGPATEAAVARLSRTPDIPGNASAGLTVLLSRMTAPDPDLRPTAEQVVAALRGELVGAMTGPEALSTAPVPVLAVPVAAGLFDEPAEGDADSAEERRREHPLLAAGVGALAVALVAALGVFISASALRSGPLGLAPVAGDPGGSSAGPLLAVTATPGTPVAPHSARPSRAVPVRPAAAPRRALVPAVTPSAIASPSPHPSPTTTVPSPSPSPSPPSASPTPSPTASGSPSPGPSGTHPDPSGSVPAPAQPDPSGSASAPARSTEAPKATATATSRTAAPQPSPSEPR